MRVETNAGDPIVARAGELVEMRYHANSSMSAAIDFRLLIAE